MKFNFSKKDVKNMKKNHFILKKKVFNLKELKKFEDEFSRISTKIKNNRDIHFFSKGKKKTISSIHNIHLYSSFYKNFIKRSGLSTLVKKLYGSKSNRIFNASLFAKPPKVGLETKPHQDNAFFNLSKGEALTCWVPINNSSKKNGTMYYYKSSGKLGDLQHLPKGNVGASMSVNDLRPLKKFKKVFVNASKGDCIIHNALVVHGSKKNISNYSRKAFNFSTSSLDKVDAGKFNNYKKNLKKFLKKRVK